jgi:hypothetical protein
MVAYAPRTMSHTIKLFEVFTEKAANGKNVTRTLPLGSIPMQLEKNLERRKIVARERAERHVGRKASNVSHADGGHLVAYFRRG